MNRNWLGLGLLAGAALLASAAWWALARNDWQPPPAQLPQLPDVQALPVPEVVTMRQALARPLLWPSRRPPEALAAEPLEADDEDGGDLKDATLEAVLESGGQRLALLRTADNDILKIGANPDQGQNALRNWRLQDFDGTTAVFISDDGQRIERRLKPTDAPAAPAAAAAAARANPPQTDKRKRVKQAKDDNTERPSPSRTAGDSDNNGTSDR